MSTQLLEVQTFDLAATLGSGQAFHWQRVDDGAYVGTIGSAAYWMRQHGPHQLEWQSDGHGHVAALRRYLGLDHDLSAIHATFPADDAWLQEAIAYSPGLRLLRQPLWETLASFITSSLKQVSHIAQISHTLRKKYGQRHEVASHEVWSYPTVEAIAAAGEAELRTCGLGYRAKFLAQSAAMIASGQCDLSMWERQEMSDAAAEAACLALPGVGPKIAACTLLFGAGRWGFFPIDVWIERVLIQGYFPRKRKITGKFLADFSRRHFGPYRGYAQQYLFHHARLTKLWDGEKKKA
jgi:N-glycosylase/DNA lyase